LLTRPVAILRAAWWTLRALRRTREELRTGKLRAVALAPPPPLPLDAQRGVHAAMRLGPHSCLERSLVMQCWLTAHGQPRDVVIGVHPPGKSFRAHAWLDGEANAGSADFQELLRLGP
jgi:Transglutaminase-like superfamily